MAEDPWPDKRCAEPSSSTHGIIQLFRETLADASDERPLQTFLAAHSHLLTSLLPPGNTAWCFDRPRFGSEYIPDFLLSTKTSTGLQWVMVELEGPTRPVLTQAGLPSAKLNEALAQIRDWRSWLRQNISYAHSELGFTDLDAECKAYVVIGRRDTVATKHVTRYRELSDEKTSTMTYDRLLDAVQRGRVHVSGTDDGQ